MYVFVSVMGYIYIYKYIRVWAAHKRRTMHAYYIVIIVMFSFHTWGGRGARREPQRNRTDRASFSNNNNNNNNNNDNHIENDFCENPSQDHCSHCKTINTTTSTATPNGSWSDMFSLLGRCTIMIIIIINSDRPREPSWHTYIWWTYNV
jgi:hypothetical protein